MSHIDEIADRYVDRAAALNPISATFSGVPGFDDRMPDLSPDGFRAQADLDRETIAALRAEEPDGESAQVAKDAMLERLGLAVEFHDAGETTRDLNILASPLQAVRQVFDLMPTEDEQAQHDLAARMSAVPEAYSGLRHTLLESAKDGRAAARRQVIACAKQCAEWSAEPDGFYGALVERTGAEGAMRADLERAAALARQATAEFGEFLETELLPYAPEQDAVGRERYALSSRFFLGAAVDLDDAYAYGWSEVKRLEAELDRVAGLILPGGTVDDAVAALDTEPGRRIAGKEAFRDWMQELADRTIADLHGKHFDIPEQARRVECMIAPTSDGGIYYTPPSEDFSRPGRMWWAVADGVEHFSTWREVTTVYHEGVPGHHLQVAQAVLQPDLNRWRRLMCWVSGHGEGWALYSERLMEELGYLDDPGELLGMLDGQMLRAARVVVDLGVHLRLRIPAGTGWHEGEVWNADLAWEFLRSHVRVEDEMLRFELNRYLGWPGQAPSYKLGERIWLQAREDIRARKGAAFDLKQFHSSALALGSLGLDPLQKALARL
ncbi:MAG: DUF885 domain-containing protein [Actinocrinis sp.]